MKMVNTEQTEKRSSAKENPNVYKNICYNQSCVF